jgi:hypothetical protein
MFFIFYTQDQIGEKISNSLQSSLQRAHAREQPRLHTGKRLSSGTYSRSAIQKQNQPYNI